MIVTDLDQMERIVAKNKNLVWDGWDVLKTRWHPRGDFYKDGRRIKGNWYRTKRFALTREGWKLPDEFKA